MERESGSLIHRCCGCCYRCCLCRYCSSSFSGNFVPKVGVGQPESHHFLVMIATNINRGRQRKVKILIVDVVRI